MPKSKQNSQSHIFNNQTRYATSPEDLNFRSNRKCRGGWGYREKQGARVVVTWRFCTSLVPTPHGVQKRMSRKNPNIAFQTPVSPSAAMMTPPANRGMHSVIWTLGPLTTMPPRSSSTVTCFSFAGKTRTANPATTTRKQEASKV